MKLLSGCSVVSDKSIRGTGCEVDLSAHRQRKSHSVNAIMAIPLNCKDKLCAHSRITVLTLRTFSVAKATKWQ